MKIDHHSEFFLNADTHHQVPIVPRTVRLELQAAVGQKTWGELELGEERFSTGETVRYLAFRMKREDADGRHLTVTGIDNVRALKLDPAAFGLPLPSGDVLTFDVAACDVTHISLGFTPFSSDDAQQACFQICHVQDNGQNKLVVDAFLRDADLTHLGRVSYLVDTLFPVAPAAPAPVLVKSKNPLLHVWI